jgi:decaprenylphospho-beta-D-erythro-pentofuranosid-2-ulose 2-reductase
VTDPFGRPSSVLVLGGTSDIARAIVRVLVAEGCERVVLAGRDQVRLAEAATEAKERGAGFVATVAFDAAEVDQAAAVVDSGFAAAGRVDLVVAAVGLLSDQPEDERDPTRVARCITVNFTWPAAALSRVAHHFTEQGSGQAVVLSTVAGVRVRRANYLYGSAKAGLDAYARNLHQTLLGSGAGITVVRPGFVRSRMTEGRQAPPLSTTPDAVARDVVRGLERRAEVVWSPQAWRVVATAFRLLPEPLWRRMPF